MDPDARTRARVEQHWTASESGDIDTEHAIYAADAILDYPQSGERFRGRSKIQAQRGGHPAERHFTILRILGDGDLWVSECIITYDGAPTYSLSVMEFTGGLVTRETQYFADPFQAPSSRAPLAEPIPGRSRAATGETHATAGDGLRYAVRSKHLVIAREVLWRQSLPMADVRRRVRAVRAMTSARAGRLIGDAAAGGHRAGGQ